MRTQISRYTQSYITTYPTYVDADFKAKVLNGFRPTE